MFAFGSAQAQGDAQNIETEFGLDVVPGTYRVTVSYPWHNRPSGGQRVYQLEIE